MALSNDLPKSTSAPSTIDAPKFHQVPYVSFSLFYFIHYEIMCKDSIVSPRSDILQMPPHRTPNGEKVYLYWYPISSTLFAR